MISPYFSDGHVELHLGNCLDVLPNLPDNSVDAVITDGPYGLAELSTTTVLQAIAAWMAGDRNHVPDGKGFMSREWDRFVPPPGAWDQCLRVLKPGGHLLAFAAPRTQDLMGLSIRIAGFEIRDGIDWIFGNGMPKGQNIAKGIDRRRDDRADVLKVTAWLAAARDTAGWTNQRIDALWGFDGMAGHWTTQGVAASVPTPEQWSTLRGVLGFDDSEILPLVEALNVRKGTAGEAWELRPAAQHERRPGMAESWTQGVGWSGTTARGGLAVLDEAQQWEGWNTSLKPAHEPIICARKSTGFNTTVANVLEHGTGAINVDACRIDAGQDYRDKCASVIGLDSNRNGATLGTWSGVRENSAHDLGRWPTNVVFSHSPACDDACAPGCPVADLDQSGNHRAGAHPGRRSGIGYGSSAVGTSGKRIDLDSGSASRFFPVFRYESKAPASERPKLDDGTTWPTVKPLELMRWLCRLVTPPGGLILDPFCGTGVTGEAAAIEGFRCILIDQDPVAAELTTVRLKKPIQPSLFGLEAS